MKILRNDKTFLIVEQVEGTEMSLHKPSKNIFIKQATGTVTILYNDQAELMSTLRYFFNVRNEVTPKREVLDSEKEKMDDNS